MEKRVSIGEYGNGYIEFLDPTGSNANEDARIHWTTELAAISRGKDKSANPPKRYKALMTEAESGRPSRPFEFMPVTMSFNQAEDLGIEEHEKAIKLAKFSHADPKSEMLYTNMRALIEAGAEYEKIPYSDDNQVFAAFRIKAPMFVWAQIVTHTQLSTESQSDRVSEEADYWLPDDLDERLDLENNPITRRDIIRKYSMDYVNPPNGMCAENFVDWMINHAPQSKVQDFLKELGYPREIYSRAPYYFKMKEFVITGLINDDDAWPHFLRERNAYMDDGGPKNWTQPETQEFSFAIRGLLEQYRDLKKEVVLNGMSK